MNNINTDVFIHKNAIGCTDDVIVINPFVLYYNNKNNKWSDKLSGDFSKIYKKLELFARTCYKSEYKITEDSADPFINMVRKKKHSGIFEHDVITVKLVGSRAMSHQLVRHRIASYLQESQRYCNYSKKEELIAVFPPSLLVKDEHEITKNKFITDFMNDISKSYKVYKSYLKAGWKTEEARYLLPNCVKTEVVVTMNLRSWMHLFKMRAFNPDADFELSHLCTLIYHEFNIVMPNIFRQNEE
jgi:thymidylate synthase (FAD)